MIRQYFLKRKIKQLKAAKFEAVKIPDFELAADFRDREQALIKKLNELNDRKK